VQKTDGDVVLSPPRVCVLPAVPPSSLLRHLIPLDLRFAIGGLVDLSALDQLPPMHGIQVHLRTHPEVLRALMQLSSMRRLRCVRLGVYDAVFIDVPSLPQLLSALPLHTLHLFVWRRRHVLGVRPSRRDGLAVLGNGLPLLEELHCDLHSWKVGLCRTALARRVRRLGLPLWQRDKPVSSSFAGLESPLLQLLALQCTKQLEDLALFGAAHMEKRFETVPPLIFRNDQCAPIPIVPDSLHEAGALAPSVGFASLHSLSVLGFRHPQIILANLASSPLPELRLFAGLLPPLHDGKSVGSETNVGPTNGASVRTMSPGAGGGSARRCARSEIRTIRTHGREGRCAASALADDLLHGLLSQSSPSELEAEALRQGPLLDVATMDSARRGAISLHLRAHRPIVLMRF
jgi:hypothetical protein